MKKKRSCKKGFTLIELLVVMVVLAVLVLLAAPKFLGKTKEATFSKHIANAKVLEDAAERYYIDHGKWPRGADEEMYTAEEVETYAERIYDITSKEITLEDGSYWDIDYDEMFAYAKLPDETERANYILRNPVGTVYYLEGLTNRGKKRLSDNEKPVKPEMGEKETESSEEEPAWEIPDTYRLASDADFAGTTNGTFRYIGSHKHVIVPEKIKGVTVTSYANMFTKTSVTGVANTVSDITDTSSMFEGSTSTVVDLRGLNTSNVTNMALMFTRSYISEIIGLDTRSVNSMNRMFQSSMAPSLDVSGFDTRNVTNMGEMFSGIKATELDLTSFHTPKLTSTSAMFANAKITTIQMPNFDFRSLTHKDNMFYGTVLSGEVEVRSHYDAYVLDVVTRKPAGLTFTVKEQAERYYVATDADFIKDVNDANSYRYRGTAQYVIVPETIHGKTLTSYRKMFSETGVKGVKSTNPNVTDLTEMFSFHQVDTIDLSALNTHATTSMYRMFANGKTQYIKGLDTTSVKTMNGMFEGSTASSLDIRSFNTENVTEMSNMFYGMKNIRHLDLRALNTSNVTSMKGIFSLLDAESIDLTTFDMSKVNKTENMFYLTTLTGTYTVRSQVEADKLNKSTKKPDGLQFVPQK